MIFDKLSITRADNGENPAKKKRKIKKLNIQLYDGCYERNQNLTLGR